MSQFGKGVLAMKFSVRELLVTLKKNRESHKEDYLKAIDGYFAECHAAIERLREQVGQKKLVNLYVQEIVPRDYTKDYDRVIKMLAMTMAPEIELNQELFDQYVMDNWSWKEGWSASNSKYLGAPE